MKKILVFLSLLGFLAFKHPFYLGVTDLRYNAKEKALQGTVRLFTNDLEEALKNRLNQPVDLINPKDTAQAEQWLKDYLSAHLSLVVNGKPLPFRLLGYENEQEATWMYIEATACPDPRTLSIRNTLLYTIRDQMNIIHLEIRDKKKSLKLNNPDAEAVFTF
jgi:hypothetical protein